MIFSNFLSVKAPEPMIIKAALDAIESLEAAADESLKLERLKASRSLRASGVSENAHQDPQSDATSCRVGAMDAAGIVREAKEAKDAWIAEVNKPREGNEDTNVLIRKAERAIATALAAGKALGLEEANRPAPNDATWIGDYNNGLYPCFEALMVIVAYFFGSTCYCFKHRENYGNIAKKDNWLIMLYFVAVTTMTIGYGDIYPANKEARVNTIFLVLAGILISRMGGIVIDNLKSWLKKRFFTSLMGWMKDGILSVLSLGTAVMCIGIGIVGILLTHEKHENKKITFVDSIYLSLVTLSTVGFGDYHFKLKAGRNFATFWIIFCYPLFRESSQFLVSRTIKLWRYIITVLLRKWIREDIPNTWWPYIKGTLVLNIWQWLLDHLSTD